MKSLGGKIESLYFAFGDPDVIIIADMPDNVTAAAASVAISATGSVGLRTVVLITPEEMDKAVKKTVTYRPPGA
jgi:uncharacterized protein with GYD domain